MGPYKKYLRWLHENLRLSIKPPRVALDAENLPYFDDRDNLVDEYDVMTRSGQ
uniref:Uncharacterized protein n=1 Tax=Arundo donax TaxID=35708 RepID=A0A0A9ASY4_ARUDO